MKKTLKSIQGLMKLGRVLSIIMLVFAIIGMVGCAIGAVSLYLTEDMVIETEEGDITLGEVMLDEITPTIESVYYLMIVGFLACLTEVIICDRTAKYFKFELSEGTPFTFEGAKKLKKLGILTIVIPIILGIIMFGVSLVLSIENPDLILNEATYGVSISPGLMMLVFALIFKHGAELNDEQKKSREEVAKIKKRAEEANRWY